jgi:hypothetical protein
MHTLNVPSYNKYFPEDGSTELKHVACTMYYQKCIYTSKLWVKFRLTIAVPEIVYALQQG